MNGVQFKNIKSLNNQDRKPQNQHITAYLTFDFINFPLNALKYSLKFYDSLKKHWLEKQNPHIYHDLKPQY